MYQVLVTNSPSDAYQKTCCLLRPIGRMAPRSFRETDSTRVSRSAATIQSVSVVPTNRFGAAPGPCAAFSRGNSRVFTPCEFMMMPVCTGKRPLIVDACPGAVSVIAWSCIPFANTAPPSNNRFRPLRNCAPYRER